MWRNLFQEHILARGLDYSIRDLVEITQLTENKVIASVYGTEEYTVEINREDKEIVALACDCPHAAAGNHCKHMAAVLFSLESGENNHFQAEKEEIIELIETTDISLIIDFLIEILANDKKLFINFKNKINQKLSTKDVTYYKNLIINIFNEYTDDYNFIHYDDAWNFIAELEYFLDQDIQSMIKNHHLGEAFDLTNFIFITLSEQPMDDSAGGITTIASICLEIWEKIISKANIEFKRKMYRWFIEKLDGSVIDYMEEYFTEILFNNFYEEEFLERKLYFLDEEIDEYRRKENSWHRKYKLSEFIVYRLEIMEKMNLSSIEIEKYCIENLELNKVRKYYINRCINNKEYKKAITLLKEGKHQENIYIGEREYYLVKLKDLYKLLGEDALYEKELREMLIEHQLGGIEAYKELKEIYSENEWLEEREDILDKLATERNIDTYYAFEGLHDRLLEVVVNSFGLFKLIEHEAMLKPLYPKELLLKYEEAVEAMAEESLGRKHYREIVSILRKMQKYPEGKTKVSNIVDQWKQAYRNRPAMMDELSKLIL